MLEHKGRKPRGRAVGYALGKDALAKAKDWPYQASYPEEVSCPHCGGNAVLAILFDDRWGNVSFSRPEGARIWPHDSMSVGNYICTECGKMMSEWNQG